MIRFAGAALGRKTRWLGSTPTCRAPGEVSAQLAVARARLGEFLIARQAAWTVEICGGNWATGERELRSATGTDSQPCLPSI